MKNTKEGRPILSARVSEGLYDEVRRAVEALNARGLSPVAWTTGDFVRAAVREKLSHMARSRRPRRKPVAPAPVATEGPADA